jgi:hypothetical protein
MVLLTAVLKKAISPHLFLARPIIRTFAASGRLLGSYVWDKGRIMAWGWSAALDLVVVEESGKVLVLSLFGERLREFSMGAAVEKGGVSQVKYPPFR